MKITIEVDCTAQEAREMMGLPDVKDMQQQWLEKMQETMMADPSHFTPDKMLDHWAKAAAPRFDMMSDMFQNFIKAATPSAK